MKPSALHYSLDVDPSRLALFLDFDGTLTPIVARPEDVNFSSQMRSLIQELSQKFPLAIISGRDLAFLQKTFDLETIYYAGSHGLDMAGPSFRKVVPQAEKLVPKLDQLEDKIQAVIHKFQGGQLERKRFSIAVHYRNVKEEEVEAFCQEIKKIKDEHLKWKYGKKFLELYPLIDWDKGKAVLVLLEEMKIRNPFPIYIGDDLTDEDAFKVIREGMGIVILEEERESSAEFQLADLDEVKEFLQKLNEVKR